MAAPRVTLGALSGRGQLKAAAPRAAEAKPEVTARPPRRLGRKPAGPPIAICLLGQFFAVKATSRAGVMRYRGPSRKPGYFTIQPVVSIPATVCLPTGWSFDVKSTGTAASFCKAVRSSLPGMWLGRAGIFPFFSPSNIKRRIQPGFLGGARKRVAGRFTSTALSLRELPIGVPRSEHYDDDRLDWAEIM
jgi:hypothetical protein